MITKSTFKCSIKYFNILQQTYILFHESSILIFLFVTSEKNEDKYMLNKTKQKMMFCVQYLQCCIVCIHECKVHCCPLYTAYGFTTIVNYNKELLLEYIQSKIFTHLGDGGGRDESRVGKWWVEMNVLRETSKFRKIYFFSPLIRSFILGHTPTLSLLITKKCPYANEHTFSCSLYCTLRKKIKVQQYNPSCNSYKEEGVVIY